MRISESIEIRDRIRKSVSYLFKYEWPMQEKELRASGVPEEQITQEMFKWMDTRAYLISLEPRKGNGI